MANRRLSRSVVLQALFAWDSADKSTGEYDVDASLNDLAIEYSVPKSDMHFVKKLLDVVLAKQNELDAVIEKAAPEWPINKIAIMDRNILRIGLAELLYADKTQVPAKVAINEAIELAKQFGGESSSKFVNGVLGAVYVEMGEPGKNDAPKRNKPKKIAYEDIPQQQLSGAIVYAKHNGEMYLAFVHDIFGHWTISKGKVDEGESPADGAVREIKEEMGIDIRIKEEVGVNEYVANDPNSEVGKLRKKVTYFLAESDFSELKLGPSGGLDDAQWFPMSQVGNLNFYEDTLRIITSAITVLSKMK